MGDSPRETTADLHLASRVREACIREALDAWEQAGISGLCHEGRFEAAVGALRRLDLEAVLHGTRAGGDAGS